MATESKLDDFAEELGKLLGSAEAKAKSWLGQRQQISKSLEGIRDSATALLAQLSGQTQPRASRSRGRVLSRTQRGGPGRPKRRKISAEGRARIAAAQRARWAKIRSEKKR